MITPPLCRPPPPSAQAGTEPQAPLGDGPSADDGESLGGRSRLYYYSILLGLQAITMNVTITITIGQYCYFYFYLYYYYRLLFGTILLLLGSSLAERPLCDLVEDERACRLMIADVDYKCLKRANTRELASCYGFVYVNVDRQPMQDKGACKVNARGAPIRNGTEKISMAPAHIDKHRET